MAGHSEEEQAGAWDAITDATREHAGGDGRVSLTSLVLIAHGRA